MARFAMARAPGAPTNATAPLATVNKAGGEAFTVTNPSLRMLTMLGSSFWNEPTYYGDSADGQRITGLSDEASLVVSTAREIARSESPRDLLALALWARTEMNIRTTPQVLLAIAAAEPATKPFVRQYCTRVVQRADEIRQVFAAYLALYAKGVGNNAPNQKLPNSLKRGLADAFGRFSEAQLMKYDSDVRPTFKDVLRMVDRGRDYALPQEIYRYFMTGEVSNPAAMPTITLRKSLAKKTELDDEARALIRESHANWEVVLSQFGRKKEVWQAVLPEMGYMALLRNLRNLIECGVDLTPVLSKLADAREVARSRQLPFRFYSAFTSVEQIGRMTPRIEHALEAALAHSTAALARLPGVTVVASDNSGSMASPVSAKSTMTRQAVSNLLAAIAHRISDEGHAIVFGESAKEVPLNAESGLIANLRKQSGTDVGHSTNAHKVLQLMTLSRIKANRLVIFSDMQCWNSHGGRETLNGAVAEYRKAVNPEMFVHSVDLAGMGKSAIAPGDPKTNLVSGFSEKILATILEFEQSTRAPATVALQKIAPDRVLPTLDDIRARF